MPKISEALFWKMRRIDGAVFRGHLTPATGVSTKERAPYRVLYARNPCFVSVGDVIFAHNNEVVILMEHPNDFEWATSFKAAYAREVLSWKRLVTTMHPVANVPMGSHFEDMGPLYVNMDSPEELNLQGLIDTGYRFITGQPVQEDDKIGDYHVQRVVRVLGVNVVYTS